MSIRDFDQTVIGNPVHDLIRFGLSMATSLRDSNLPGVSAVAMLEAIMEGYEQAFEDADDNDVAPKYVKKGLRQSVRRTWAHLARERIRDTRPKMRWFVLNWWSTLVSNRVKKYRPLVGSIRFCCWPVGVRTPGLLD